MALKREQVLSSVISLFQALEMTEEEATDLVMAISIKKAEFKVLKALENRYEGNNDVPTKDEVREIVAQAV
jgi:hypothetical protein